MGFQHVRSHWKLSGPVASCPQDLAGVSGGPRGSVEAAVGSLGGPWGVPGGSLGVLGRTLGASKNIEKTLVFVVFPAHGVVLDDTWSALGCPGADLGGSWGFLGLTRGSLDALGGSWGVPGGSLGGPWGPLGGSPELRGPLTNSNASPGCRRAGRERGPRVPGGIKGGNKQ